MEAEGGQESQLEERKKGNRKTRQRLMSLTRPLLGIADDREPLSCDAWDGPMKQGRKTFWLLAAGCWRGRGCGAQTLCTITDRLSQQAPSLQFGNWACHAPWYRLAKSKSLSSASSTRRPNELMAYLVYYSGPSAPRD